MPTEPHPVNPVRPRPLPGPKPAEPTPAAPSKVPSLRLAVAMVAVGLIGLTLHFWLPVILFAAWPTRERRKAAISWH